ncbi:MAG: hypothetical protein Kow0042_28330 [Calditrichia bacterium]
MIDISKPTQPVVLDSFSQKQKFSTNYRHITFKGDTVCLVDQGNGIIYFLDPDISASLKLISSISVEKKISVFPNDLYPSFYHNIGFISRIREGLYLYDITHLNSPLLIKRFQFPGVMPLRVMVHGSNLLVFGIRSGLYIFDIRNPQTPVLLNHLWTEPLDYFGDASLQDSLICTGGAYGKVQLVNIKNPANPQIIATISLDDRLQGFCILGSWLFVAGEKGVGVYSLVNPRSPSLVARAQTGDSWRIVVKNHLAYVNGNRSDLLVVDLSPLF